jgi:hypothetical protein
MSELTKIPSILMTNSLDVSLAFKTLGAVSLSWLNFVREKIVLGAARRV